MTEGVKLDIMIIVFQISSRCQVRIQVFDRALVMNNKLLN